MSEWVNADSSHLSPRAKIPDPSPGARLRLMNKLSNRARSRLNPQTGHREFLLHRQMSMDEFNGSVNGNHINHLGEKDHTSWTPFLSNITESSGIYSK